LGGKINTLGTGTVTVSHFSHLLLISAKNLLPEQFNIVTDLTTAEQNKASKLTCSMIEEVMGSTLAAGSKVSAITSSVSR
jgi:hypothetical protein